MKNRNTFSRYVYELHETVNKMLGKKSGLTYCDVGKDTNISEQDVLKKNQKFLNSKKIKPGKKKVVPSLYMERNQMRYKDCSSRRKM